MKSYIVMAYKFMEYAVRYIENFDDEDSIVEGMCEASKKFHIRAQYACGSARHVIVTKKFVIKWDKNEQCVYQIGGCSDELKMYDKARLEGYNHLLAKITPIYINKKYYYVMPTINNVGPQYHKELISYYLSYTEYKWVKNNIDDLHNYNWGIENGKAVIIDYAYH